MRCLIPCLAAVGAAVGSAGSANAQFELAWIKQYGTWADESGRALVLTDTGGVFCTGDTVGDFGGPGLGGRDAYIARFDDAGRGEWIKQFGTATQDGSVALATDGSGGFFATGWTIGALGGPHAGSTDVWLARCNGTGEQRWAIQFGGPTSDEPYALASDAAGGVFLSGTTTNKLGGTGSGPVFLARYDDAGNRYWLMQFGKGFTRCTALAPDGESGVYAAGFTNQPLGGPNAGHLDAFLARYSGAGEMIWIAQLGTVAADEAYGVAPDGAGGAFVAGRTGGSLSAPNSGQNDVFLAHYDSRGGQSWVKQFGSKEHDRANALASDGSGGVLVTGLWGGVWYSRDAFAARFDAAGQQTWFAVLAGVPTNLNEALALVPAGSGDCS